MPPHGVLTRACVRTCGGRGVEGRGGRVSAFRVPSAPSARGIPLMDRSLAFPRVYPPTLPAPLLPQLKHREKIGNAEGHGVPPSRALLLLYDAQGFAERLLAQVEEAPTRGGSAQPPPLPPSPPSSLPPRASASAWCGANGLRRSSLCSWRGTNATASWWASCGTKPARGWVIAAQCEWLAIPFRQ